MSNCPVCEPSRRAGLLRCRDCGITLGDPVDDALECAKLVITKALPKFNWRDSALDAEAIGLLNELPGKLALAIDYRAREQDAVARLNERLTAITKTLEGLEK